jgi:hypothetical protein
MLLAGLLVGCGNSDEPASNSQPASISFNCSPSNITKINLPAILSGENQTNGWSVIGKAIPEQKNNLVIGNFNNQIARQIGIETNSKLFKINLPVSGSVIGATIILDTIWLDSNLNEIFRSAPSIQIDNKLTATFDFVQEVPKNSSQLVIIARPWRDIDGIINVKDGNIDLCKSN